MTVIVAFLRFTFGVAVTAVLMLALSPLGLVPLWLAVAASIAVGLVAALFGDRVLLALLKPFRWLS